MNVDLNRILEDLSRRQFLHPHTSIEDTLGAATIDLGICPEATRAALGWLEINPRLSMGRLRRTALTQLSRSIHRFCNHAGPIDIHQSAK